MKKIKEFLMKWLVNKLVVERLGKAIAKAEGKRTWIGIAVIAILSLCKFVLPLFVPVPPEILQAIDALLLIISGATGSFASIKAQNVWKEVKKAGDEVIK